MLQTGYLKLILQNGEVFPDTVLNDFTLSSTSDLRIGVVNETATQPAALVLSQESITVAKPTDFVAPVAFATVKSNAIEALDQTADLSIVAPTDPQAKLRLEEASFKNGTFASPTVLAEVSRTDDAYDHVLHVGRDSLITATSYVPGVLKVAGYVLPTALVPPTPVDATLTDPDAIAQEALRYETDLQAAKDAVEAANAANTAAASADVSLDVATVVAKVVTHPDTVTHTTHSGNAEFKDYVRIEKVLTLGDTDDVLASIRHSAPDLTIDAMDGAPGSVELSTVGFHAGNPSRVSATHGGVVGAWDVLDVVQSADMDNDKPGIVRMHAAMFASTSGTAANDNAIVDGPAGVSVVEVDNGSLATYTTLNMATAQLWNGTEAANVKLDGASVVDVDRRMATFGGDFKDPDGPKVVHVVTRADHLAVDAPMDTLGLRLGGVDILRVDPTVDDPSLGVSVSERLTAPVLKVSAEVDKYFELTAHPGTGAMTIESTEGRTATLLPAETSLDVTPARLRLIDVPSGSYTEMVGGNDQLALSVPSIRLVDGMSLQESEKTLVVVGCEALRLETCTLDASTDPAVLAISNAAMSLGGDVTMTAESSGNLLLGPSPDVTVRTDATLTLQSEDAVKLRLKSGSQWNEYGFTSRNDGALLLNGHDIDVIPKDILTGSTARDGAVDAAGWWRTDVPSVAAKFSHSVADTTEYPLLSDLTFVNSVAQPYAGATPVMTNGYTGFGVDLYLDGAYVLRRVNLPRVTVGQHDNRPTSWRVYGTDGRAMASSTWEELGRAGFQDHIDVYTQNAYDGYRIVVNSISSGDSLVNNGLQLLTLPPAQSVAVQHSFTGSHLTAFVDDPALEPGMLVSVARDGTLDSIARGGWKRRGGSSAIRIDSALPMVAMTTRARDPTVFGVFDSAVSNRWYSRGVDVRARVNGLGEGAVWVCDTGGALRVGDLLCSSDVPGYAMRQNNGDGTESDDIVRSYTVGKCTMSCDFSNARVPVNTLVHKDSGDVSWYEEPIATEPAFLTRVLADGTRCAYIACVYTCS